jgi:hypothetical protein
MQNLNGEAKNPIASERLGHTDGATLRIDPGAGSSPVCPGETLPGDVLTLEGLEPRDDEGVRFEVTRKDWLAIARIIAVDNRVDARVVSRMFDPQVGEEFGSEVTEGLDIALFLILEWLDRFRADRIYLSASAVRIRDEHNHLDPGTNFLDLQAGWDDPGIEFDRLYRFRHFLVFSEGFRIFRILQPVPKPVSSSETLEAPEDSRVPSDRPFQGPGLDFGDDDDDFNFADDEEDSCSCSGDIGATAVGEDQAPRSNRSAAGRGCPHCGIGGCHACTHGEMYALDLVDAFCSFAAKQTGDLDRAMGLVRSLCDELVFLEMEEGWAWWRGDLDYRVATIATCAIRNDTYLLSSLSACLAEPDDPRISAYHEAKRGALEQVRASYPDELRPADVTVFG